MIRITALNEETDCSVVNDEFKVTKEAQETIAVSEYMRALKLKSTSAIDDALNLFTELLETQVLNEVQQEKRDKLFSVKYNCFRNIGLIHADREEFDLAIENLLQAIEMDDTDVHTIYTVGKIALKNKNSLLARSMFERCMKINPNHWLSMDGILQCLCADKCIFEAFGWAYKCYEKNNNYRRSLEVLTEINFKFSAIMPFLTKSWNVDPTSEKKFKDSNNIANHFPVVWVETKITGMEDAKINYDEFKIGELNWITLGKLIYKLSRHLIDNNENLATMFKLDDFLDKNDVPVMQEEQEVEMKTPEEESKTEKSDQEVLENTDKDDTDGNNDDEIRTIENAESSEENMNKTPLIETKPKSRRRGSDLTFLEQWGWHKNRRSARKKTVPDKEETLDNTINCFIKRILPNYFKHNFDSSQLPFSDTINNTNNLQRTDVLPNNHFSKNNIEQFHVLSKAHFDELITLLREREFDMIIMVHNYLKYISLYWNINFPSELNQIYVDIFKIFETFNDYSSWTQLSEDEIRANFDITLFYLELSQDLLENSAKNISKPEISCNFWLTLNYIKYYLGFLLKSDDYNLLYTRMIWLNFSAEKYDNNLSLALDYLHKLKDSIADDPKQFTISLPNQENHNYYDFDIILDSIIKIERQISLSNVKTLYENEKYSDIILILKDSLINSIDTDITIIQTQIEVLLESFWCTDNMEECFIWSEKCLKYSTDNFLSAINNSEKQKKWGANINFIMVYIEALILEEGPNILICLNEYINRLVQTITKILTHQLDSVIENRNNIPEHSINTNMPWIILSHILQREDDKIAVIKRTNQKPEESFNDTNEELEDAIPNTLLLFFTAHDFLGRRQWCSKENSKLLCYTLDFITPLLRTPLYDRCRSIINEYLEQITFCLYSFPAKKTRSRHIEDHEATNIELTWEKAVQLFDIYRPDSLPEFNSYKFESITAEMELHLQKVIGLIPKNLDASCHVTAIRNFINGTMEKLPDPVDILPKSIKIIYFLLADYYFKSRDFSKATKFYVMDLALNPKRFDSWAGLALSKASKIETKLNASVALSTKEFLQQAEDSMRCFQQCLRLCDNNPLLFIEYGSFAYNIHSYCSRNLKQSSDTLSMESFTFMEEKKEKCLNIAWECFNTVNNFPNTQGSTDDSEEDEAHEKWLYVYMLGKICEKRKDPPEVYLNYYIQSSKYLFENNATYPIKINHSNPTNLSIEALEIFYRISAAIMKYVEQHSPITKGQAKIFNRILKDLASSPFANNRAKLNDNILKRKLPVNNSDVPAKQIKLDVNEANAEIKAEVGVDKMEEEVETTQIASNPIITDKEDTVVNNTSTEIIKIENIKVEEPQCLDTKQLVPQNDSPSRRVSQESATTSTITTTTNSSGTTSSSSSTSSSSTSDSSSSDDSDSSSDEEDVEKKAKKEKSNNELISQEDTDAIYKICIKNLEECVSRFPEHYKSMYRLIYHYLNAPNITKSIEKCKELLLGSYKTTLGNQIGGLFNERKSSNFFNGIWRIPSSEIDRPGNFSSHLSKCVIILMEVLKISADYEILFELSLQLYRNPDADKKYLKDTERKELFQQAISFCVQSFRHILSKHIAANNNIEKLNLLIEIYKTYRKCIKHMHQKENLFSTVLIETYKSYIEDRFKVPENANLIDLAIKLCQHEINAKKNPEKYVPTQVYNSALNTNTPVAATHNNVTSNVNISAVTIPITTPTPTIATAIATPPTTSTTITPITNIPNVSKSTTNAATAGKSKNRGRPVGTTKNPFPSFSPNLPNNSNNNNNSSLLAMYNNPSFLASMAQLQDTALLSEYYMNMNSQMNSLTSLYGGNVGNLNAALASLYNTQTQALPQSQQSAARNVTAANNEMKYMEFLAQNLLRQSYNLDANKVTITPTNNASSITPNSTTSSKSKSNSTQINPDKNITKIKEPANKLKTLPTAEFSKLPATKKMAQSVPDLAKLYPVNSPALPVANLNLSPNLTNSAPPAKKRKRTQQSVFQDRQIMNPQQYSKTLDTLNIFNKLSKSISITPEIVPKSNLLIPQQQAKQQSHIQLPQTTISPIPSIDANLSQQQQLLFYNNYLNSFKSAAAANPPSKSKKQSNTKTAINQQTANFALHQAVSQLSVIPKPKSQKQNPVFNLPKTQTSGSLTITPSMGPSTKSNNKFMNIPMGIKSLPSATTATLTTSAPTTKTLQQKIAERQKEIKAKMESSSSGTGNTKQKSNQTKKMPYIDDDVIVLDE